MATLTYDYRDSTVVLGPLATVVEPNAYDLCEDHAEHLTAPKGWQVVRLATKFEPAPPSSDDLLALVDAVRQAAHSPSHASPRSPSGSIPPKGSSSLGQRPSRVEAENPSSYGPFTSRSIDEDTPGFSGRASRGVLDTHEPTSMRVPDTSSPLDPASVYAKRRAQFTVVSNRSAQSDPLDEGDSL